jgi:4-amino-4-deoxy-L-arabinose transferase-like glycosyltransferase
MSCLLLLAAVPRFYRLGWRSLWADELFSASASNDHPLWPADGVPLFERLRILDVQLGQSFWTVKAADQSPPLFELLAKLSINLFGLSEFAMRLPSALAGVLLVLWLGWRGLKSAAPRERLTLFWAALLCAVTPSLIAYGQEARVYSVGTLWAGLLATGWYERWARGWRQAALPGWCEVAVFTLACYSHNNLIVLSAILLSAYGWEALRRRDVKAVMRLTCAPLAYLPWFALSVHTYFFTMDRGIAWADLTWIQAVTQELRGLPSVFPLAWLAAAALLLAVPGLMGRFRPSIAARLGVDGQDAAMKAFWALAGATLIYFLLIAAVVARSGVYHYRHILFVVPFLALMVGVAASGLQVRAAQAVLAVLAVLAVVSPLREVYLRPTSDFRAAYRFALSRVSGQGPIVGITPADRRFYVDMLEPRSKRELIFLAEYETGAYQRGCDRLIALGADTVVITHPWREPFLRSLFKHCGDHFRVAERMTGEHNVAEGWRFVGPPAPSQPPAR